MCPKKYFDSLVLKFEIFNYIKPVQLRNGRLSKLLISFRSMRIEYISDNDIDAFRDV